MYLVISALLFRIGTFSIFRLGIVTNFRIRHRSLCSRTFFFAILNALHKLTKIKDENVQLVLKKYVVVLWCVLKAFKKN